MAEHEMSHEVASVLDTRDHCARVQGYLHDCVSELLERGRVHDESKYGDEERPLFARAHGRLKEVKYGSPEYKAALDAIRPAIDHHQQSNSHHPEFYPHGILDMSLFDVLEMLCDWKAAGERTKDGSIARSLQVNARRFQIASAVMNLLVNTAIELGWIETADERELR